MQPAKEPDCSRYDGGLGTRTEKELWLDSLERVLQCRFSNLDYRKLKVLPLPTIKHLYDVVSDRINILKG